MAMVDRCDTGKFGPKLAHWRQGSAAHDDNKATSIICLPLQQQLPASRGFGE